MDICRIAVSDTISLARCTSKDFEIAGPVKLNKLLRREPFPQQLYTSPFDFATAHFPFFGPHRIPAAYDTREHWLNSHAKHEAF
jgi:hypothetical protein